MPASGALAQLGARRSRVHGVAADAVENGLAPFAFETPVIAAIIVEPQSQKNRGNEDAVDHDGCGRLEHSAHDGTPNVRRQALSALLPSRAV